MGLWISLRAVSLNNDQMAGYLDRIGAGKILLDRTPLSYDWIPSTLVGRDDALSQLASIFSQISNPSISCKSVVTGPVGSGKTVLTQVFSNDLKRHLDGKRKIIHTHVNCRNHPSGSQVLQQIALSLDERHPERGLSPGEVIQSIRRFLNARDAHMLLVLDEVDVMIRRDSSDIIYRLLRIDEGKDESGTISIILVSQDPSLLRLFEPAIISRLGASNRVDLGPYNEAELRDIALQRSEASCLKGSVGDDVISKVARYASNTGDARMVIELLEAAVIRAEGEGRSNVLVHVVRPSEMRSSSLEPNLVDDLPDHQKLILLGICRRLKKVDTISSGDALKLYHVVCEEFGHKPRGYTTFWKHMKSLETMGLIESRTDSATKGRGRTQHITMSNMAPGVLESRLSSVLLIE